MSLVCDMLKVELCSSDHCWANATSPYRTFKMSFKMTVLMEASTVTVSIVLFLCSFCCHHGHLKLRSPLGDFMHNYQLSVCLFAPTACQALLDIVGNAEEG